jgi:hypothetical protein
MPKVLIATEKPLPRKRAKDQGGADAAKYEYSFLENDTDVKELHAALESGGSDHP